MKSWQKLVALVTCLAVFVSFSCADITTTAGADDRFTGTAIDLTDGLNSTVDLDATASYYSIKVSADGLYTLNFKGHQDMKDLRFDVYDATDKHDLVFFNMQWITQPETVQNVPEFKYEYNLSFEGEKGKTYYLKMNNAPKEMEKVTITGIEGVEKQEYVDGESVYIPANKVGTVTFKPKKTSVYVPKMNTGYVNMVQYDFDTVYTETNGDEVTTTTVGTLGKTGGFGYTFIKGKTYQLKLVNDSNENMEFSLEDNVQSLLTVTVDDIDIAKKSQITYSVSVKDAVLAAFKYVMDEKVVFDAYTYNQGLDSYTSILRNDKGALLNEEDCLYDEGQSAQYNLSLKQKTNYYITISAVEDETLGELEVAGDGLALVEATESNSRPIIIPTKKPTTTAATVTTKAPVATTAVPPAAVNTFPALGTLLVDTKTKATFKVTMIGQEVEYVKPKSKNVKAVTIPASVTIGGITYKVTSIKAKCFKGYKKLAKITIGKNVKKIGKQAFYNCKKLKTIIFKTKLLKSSKVGAKAFAKIHKKAVAKIPKKKLKAYKKCLKKKGMSGKNQKFKKA